MISQSKIKKKIAEIYDFCDRTERGMWTGKKVSTITDEIDWLWRFRYISREEMEFLTDRVIYVMQNCFVE